MKVYIVTKQLVLPLISTPPFVLGVYDSFYKATKNISTTWIKLSDAQWGYEYDTEQYIRNCKSTYVHRSN